MAADRRVDPAGGTCFLGQQRLIERLAHAVQALELVTLDPARLLDHARHRERVVGGELRKYLRASRDQPAHAVHVTKIGHGLAGEHGIIGQSAFLGALDLAVPIGALDESHAQAAAQRLRRADHPIDHRRRAFLIGLHREPEPRPAGERRIGEHQADQLQRELQAIRLLGIDRELQIAGFRPAGQRQEFGPELGQHARPRDRLETRVERGELDRDAGPIRGSTVCRVCADRIDGGRVGAEIALGIRRGSRGFAQHVEGIAEFAVRGRPRERLLDGFAENEMRAQ